MAVGDLVASSPVLVDSNDPVLIKSTIDALNLAATTDFLFVVPVAQQNKFAIFKVERASA
ncbi:hypothetical protein LCGC14_1374800 [marine sediment metagenome]|uniref:Uncharacterized protein n=1 Tax=marine sediment metagenome TaxID=412755 RepID=A0A0F9KQD9_9ZZZZ